MYFVHIRRYQSTFKILRIPQRNIREVCESHLLGEHELITVTRRISGIFIQVHKTNA